MFNDAILLRAHFFPASPRSALPAPHHLLNLLIALGPIDSAKWGEEHEFWQGGSFLGAVLGWCRGILGNQEAGERGGGAEGGALWEAEGRQIDA